MKRWGVRIVTVLVLLPVLGFALASLFSRRPSNLGVREGKLAPCPDSPNCVSSQSTSAVHQLDPWEYEESSESILKKLKEILRSLPRTRIVTEEENYLHAEATSAIFRFVDDIEIFIDESNKQIHFRSASRVGHSDLGVNRDRIEEIRKRFENG